MYLQRVISKERKKIFVAFLKVTDENSRIRSRIRIRWSEERIQGSGSGSAPKYHGSATLREILTVPVQILGKILVFGISNIKSDFLKTNSVPVPNQVRYTPITFLTRVHLSSLHNLYMNFAETDPERNLCTAPS
jgi:hypothetical protein